MSYTQADRQQVQSIKWFHRIDFGDGLITDGTSNNFRRLKRLKLPSSFAGKSVLDIGSWDGFYAFEAERRNASRVLATDSFMWERPNGKAGFDCAKRLLKSNVEEQHIDIMDLSPERVGEFDVVLFLGVLYHLRHPLLGLERVASVTKELVIVETLVDMLSCARPAIAFYPDSEMCGDKTNWVGPNPAAVIAMLKQVGFSRVEMVNGPDPYWFRLAFAVQQRFIAGHNFLYTLRTGRAVFHAWK